MEAVDSLSITAAARWRLAAQRAVTHSLLIWPPLAVGWVLDRPAVARLLHTES